MENYVNQLIEEILSKHKPNPEPEKWEDVDIEDALDELIEYSDEELEYQEEKADQDLETHFQEIERYLSGDEDQKISEIVGLEKDQFPATEMLSDDQKSNLLTAMQEMLISYHIIYDFPENLPLDLKYDLMVDSLDNEVFVTSVGYNHLDFCGGDIDSCKLGGEYCVCNQDPDFEEPISLFDFLPPTDEDNKTDWDDDELPF